MTVYQHIQRVAKNKNISIRQIEIALGFSNGSLRKWKNSAPSDRLTRVANYLGTTSDYLILGQNSSPSNNSINEQKTIDLISTDIVKKIVSSLASLDDNHRQRVYAYIQAQIEDQERIADLPETLAAHQSDSSHHIDKIESKRIADGLDQIARKNAKK